MNGSSDDTFLSKILEIARENAEAMVDLNKEEMTRKLEELERELCDKLDKEDLNV